LTVSLNAEVPVTTHKSNLPTMGQRVAESRLGAGMSVGQLARATGVDPYEIQRVEDGGEVGTVELTSIAAATGKNLDFFLFLDDDVSNVLLRKGVATPDETAAAVEVLARFVRDYEFLRQLEG
jgi:transcriptional regulator with XRE-family HTH domain